MHRCAALTQQVILALQLLRNHQPHVAHALQVGFNFVQVLVLRLRGRNDAPVIQSPLFKKLASD